MKLPNAIWGTVALICLDVIVFFSTQYWRQKAYNLFLSTHIIGFVIVMPAVSLIIVERKPNLISRFQFTALHA